MGTDGRLVELTSAGEIVWDLELPFVGDADPPYAPPPCASESFRATRIAPDHPALAGRNLRALHRDSSRRPSALGRGREAMAPRQVPSTGARALENRPIAP